MKKNLNTTCIVPFRKGSKGFTEKNFRDFCGEPLWLRSVKQGHRICDRVICSSDSNNLKHQELDASTITHQRPDHLATDAAEMRGVITELVNKYKLDEEILILLQPTSPLRSDASISQALELYKTGDYSLVISVTKSDNKCLKYGLQENGVFKPINKRQYLFSNRQTLPEVYAPNGAVYIFQARDFRKINNFPSDRIGFLEMDELESLDIDTKQDFVFAQEAALTKDR